MNDYHKNKQIITCEFCEMTFKSTSGMIKHRERKHSTKEPKACELCGKRFPDAHGLTRHNQIVHLGLKPYSCTFCDQSFSGHRNWKMHELVKHTDPEGLLKKYFNIFVTGVTSNSMRNPD